MPRGADPVLTVISYFEREPLVVVKSTLAVVRSIVAKRMAAQPGRVHAPGNGTVTVPQPANAHRKTKGPKAAAAKPTSMAADASA